MAGCRLASKGRTMADSSYASEVQAILAFLSLQRTGTGGSGNQPQGPDASPEGLNPYGLVAPRFQRKFKAKQVPERVGVGMTTAFIWPSLAPGSPWRLPLNSHVLTHPVPTYIPQPECAGPRPEGRGSWSSCPRPPWGLAQLTVGRGRTRVGPQWALPLA